MKEKDKDEIIDEDFGLSMGGIPMAGSPSGITSNAGMNVTGSGQIRGASTCGNQSVNYTTLGNVNGMGAVISPTATTYGSGDSIGSAPKSHRPGKTFKKKNKKRKKHILGFKEYFQNNLTE